MLRKLPKKAGKLFFPYFVFEVYEENYIERIAYIERVLNYRFCTDWEPQTREQIISLKEQQNKLFNHHGRLITHIALNQDTWGFESDEDMKYKEDFLISRNSKGRIKILYSDFNSIKSRTREILLSGWEPNKQDKVNMNLNAFDFIRKFYPTNKEEIESQS